MIFKWESEEERLARLMKISPKKKLEWLRQMNRFVVKCSSKRSNLIRRKLRNNWSGEKGKEKNEEV